jgi:hypothetical protein
MRSLPIPSGWIHNITGSSLLANACHPVPCYPLLRSMTIANMSEGTRLSWMRSLGHIGNSHTT